MRPSELRDDDLPAVFWDNLPTDENNVDLAAIRALEAESTPDERAENAKIQGNEAFKRGVQLRKRFYLQEAVDAYTKGIDVQPRDPTLLSLLHSNRAQAHLRLANNRKALNDALRAIQLDATLDKAYCRAVQAAQRLEDFHEALALGRKAMDQNADSPELQKLLQQVRKQQDAVEQAERNQAAADVAKHAPARRLALTLMNRGWRLGRPQLHIGNRKPYVDQLGHVHWPVLFMYPEPMQMDAVEDVDEIDPIAAHLDAMFPSDGSNSPEWDSQHAYQRHYLQLYYLSNAATPLSIDQLTEVLYGGWPENVQDEGPKRYGSKAAHWVAVDESMTLADILSQADYVVPGIPVFFVLVKGSQFQHRFLADEIPLL